MRDVAAHAGVSTSLVSLVFREPQRVSEKRRAAVLRAAEDLGYRRNYVASSLKRQRTRLLAAVVSDLQNPFFVEVFDAFQAAATAGGYRSFIGSSSRDPALEQRVADAAVELRVDGLALMGPLLPVAAIKRLGAVVPVVTISRPDSRRAAVDVVATDDARGSALAVNHLAGLGHRRITHLTGGRGAGAAERRRGYETAMRASDLEGEVSNVEAGYDERSGYEAVQRILQEDRWATALFAANDLAALGAIQALEDAGWRVPEDVSVIGYDNTTLAARRQFALTTVDQDRQTMGRLAVELLLDRIESGRRRSRQQLLEPHLVIRRSTAPPRAAVLAPPAAGSR